MKANIVCGGVFDLMPPPDSESNLIACDRGYDYCLKSKLKADLIVGDFDSSKQYVPDGNVIVLPHEKDDTDSLFAVKCAIEKGFTEIDLYCALGGRPDHEMANYQIMEYCMEKGVHCALIGSGCKIFLCNSSISIKREHYKYLSVFSWTEKCSGVSISGAHYNLDNAEISRSFPLGISNEWEADVVEITVKSGILLIMCVCQD